MADVRYGRFLGTLIFYTRPTCRIDIGTRIEGDRIRVDARRIV